MSSNRQRWDELVSSYVFQESCLDRTPIFAQVRSVSARTFTCPDCSACFSNSKACPHHRRVVNQYRDPVLQRIDGLGVCSACSTIFHTWLRVIAHVCDRRNNLCKLWILENCLSLFPRALAELEHHDRLARGQSRKLGHTHVTASSHAIKLHGRLIGRVSM